MAVTLNLLDEQHPAELGESDLSELTEQWDFDEYPTSKLTRPPTICCNLVWINKYEFTTAGEINIEWDHKTKRLVEIGGNGIFIYNIKYNKWRLHIKYTKHVNEIDGHSICYNSKTNILYLYSSNDIMLTFNMKTKESQIFPANVAEDNLEPELLIINDKCHLIGGQCNNSHLVWNDNTNKFETIYSFTDFKEGIFYGKIIHVKSKNILYLFGGYDVDIEVCSHSIWKCEINDNYKWKKLNDQFKLECYEYIPYFMTSDEKYVIFLRKRNETCIMDIDSKALYKCYNYDCGGRGKMHGIICDDISIEHDLLVYGYIHLMSKQINISIPYQLIDILKRYYIPRNVHLIAMYGHINFPIDDIFNADKVLIN